MTFSLVARCPDTGMFGVAISSSSPAVAARCAHARGGVGAVASQNVTDPLLGQQALDLLAAGKSANEAVSELQAASAYMEYRQLLVVDVQGETAIHSGERSLGIWTQAEGLNVASGGNLLANESVPETMVKFFEQSKGHLGERLLSALRAGLDAGGEAGPVHSAGLMVVDKVPWPVVDLRCDWSEECPIDVLSAAWAVYRPQIEAYVQRALDPREAPSYGVPGDD